MSLEQYEPKEEDLNELLESVNQPVVDSIEVICYLALDKEKKKGVSFEEAKKAVSEAIINISDEEVLALEKEYEEIEDALGKRMPELKDAIFDARDNNNFSIEQAKKFVLIFVKLLPPKPPRIPGIIELDLRAYGITFDYIE